MNASVVERSAEPVPSGDSRRWAMVRRVNRHHFQRSSFEWPAAAAGMAGGPGEREGAMTRSEVYRDIEGTLGLVPSMFKTLPDDSLELEWSLFKQVQLSEDVIPAKYRELIGLAAGAALSDRYCIAAHREFARACGASEEEIECALRLTKGVAGWGAYLVGSESSVETVQGEIRQICDFIRSGRMMGAGGGTERVGVSTH